MIPLSYDHNHIDYTLGFNQVKKPKKDEKFDVVNLILCIILVITICIFLFHGKIV